MTASTLRLAARAAFGLALAGSVLTTAAGAAQVAPIYPGATLRSGTGTQAMVYIVAAPARLVAAWYRTRLHDVTSILGDDNLVTGQSESFHEPGGAVGISAFAPVNGQDRTQILITRW
jgi:hypothetical protein